MSLDLRERIVRAVENGSSMRAAARRFAVSASAAIKLMRRVRETGSAAPARYGGHRRPLLEPYEADLTALVAALEPVWDELYPAEQARILRLLIERVAVAPDGISVTLHAAGVRSFVPELAHQEGPALAASESLLEAAEQ
jgi:hypothetical protein